MKVFVVQTGDYSDEYIVGIFSTQEKAERIAKLYEGSVREQEVDKIDNVPEGCWFYSVEMRKDGEVILVRAKSADDYDANYGWDYNSYPENDHMTFFIWAKDEDHAIKIANEKRSMLIATECWGMDWDEFKETRI